MRRTSMHMAVRLRLCSWLHHDPFLKRVALFARFCIHWAHIDLRDHYCLMPMQAPDPSTRADYPAFNADGTGASNVCAFDGSISTCDATSTLRRMCGCRPAGCPVPTQEGTVFSYVDVEGAPVTCSDGTCISGTVAVYSCTGGRSFGASVAVRGTNKTSSCFNGNFQAFTPCQVCAKDSALACPSSCITSTAAAFTHSSKFFLLS